MIRCSATVRIGVEDYRCKLDEDGHEGDTHVTDVGYRIAGIAQETPGEFRWHEAATPSDEEDLAQYRSYALGQRDYAAERYLASHGASAHERAYAAGWASQIPETIPENVRAAYLSEYPYIANYNDWDGEARREDVHRFAVRTGLMTYKEPNNG